MVTSEQVKSALESTIPNEIAEILTPQIHQTAEGGASALILNFIGFPKPDPPTTPPLGPENPDLAPITPSFTPPVPVQQPEMTPLPQDTPERKLPRFSFTLPSFLVQLPKKQRIIMAVILLLLIILSISILSVKSQQTVKQNQSLFTETYEAAQKKFDEGKGLSELNKPLAHDSFTAAEKTVQAALPKFSKNSEEYKKLTVLLTQIATELAKTEGNVTVATKEVPAGTSVLLDEIQKTKDAITGITTGSAIAVLTSSAVTFDGKEIIKNDDLWTDAKGLGTFLGNFYVLDTKKGVLKFSGSSYSESSYFSGDAPDLSRATSMTIDGSVWILFSNGNLEKYTKGAKDTFSIKGLSEAFSKPTRVITTADTQKLYVLDPGSSRIVVLKKDGTFETQYKADVLRNAKEVDISEKDRKAYILSGSKVYELSL
jgi:hypothetical protein